jgi:hypothetical protein
MKQNKLDQLGPMPTGDFEKSGNLRMSWTFQKLGGVINFFDCEATFLTQTGSP